jgi:hypothetical protein
MGQDHGVGFDGVDAKGSKPTVVETIRGATDPRRSSQPIKLLVRWESALPVRAAEMRVRSGASHAGRRRLSHRGLRRSRGLLQERSEEFGESSEKTDLSENLKVPTF